MLSTVQHKIESESLVAVVAGSVLGGLALGALAAVVVMVIATLAWRHHTTEKYSARNVIKYT